MIGYSHKIAEEGLNTTQPKQQGWVQKIYFSHSTNVTCQLNFTKILLHIYKGYISLESQHTDLVFVLLEERVALLRPLPARR